MHSQTKSEVLFYGFAILLAAVIAISVFSFINVNNLMDSSKWVAHTYEVINSLESLNGTVVAGESGVRSYVITGQDSYLDDHKRLKQVIESQLFSLRNLTIDNDTQQKRMDILESKIRQKIRVMDDLIRMRKEQGMQPAIDTINNGVPYRVMEEARLATEAMRAEEQRLLDERFGRARLVGDQTRACIPTLVFIVFAGLCGCYFWVKSAVLPT